MDNGPVVPPDTKVTDILTPRSSAGLLGGSWLPALAARVGANIAAGRKGPIQLGKYAIFARHEDVSAVLARDLDFRIAPVNETRILEVNGPFVLGMDRGAAVARERDLLYEALAHIPFAPLAARIETLANERIVGAGSGPLDIVSDYARPIAAQTAVGLFGVAGSSPEMLMEVARAVFAHTFLNLGNDKTIRERAIRASKLMAAWISAEIDRRIAAKETGADLIGGMLEILGANPDVDLIRRSIGGMLVGSIDTTASTVAKIMSVIVQDAALAKAIAVDLDDPKKVAGWCWEALRRWPHNPILLRETVADTIFGDSLIKAGSTVVLWTQAAMLDPSVFPDPERLRPDRPVAKYFHFGGALHVCAGRAVNGFQIPILVGALLRRGVRGLGKMDWAGPFPDSLPAELT